MENHKGRAVDLLTAGQAAAGHGNHDDVDEEQHDQVAGHGIKPLEDHRVQDAGHRDLHLTPGTRLLALAQPGMRARWRVCTMACVWSKRAGVASMLAFVTVTHVFACITTNMHKNDVQSRARSARGMQAGPDKPASLRIASSSLSHPTCVSLPAVLSSLVFHLVSFFRHGLC